MAKVDYSRMTSAELQREQERLNADIDKNMRRLKITLIIFVIACAMMALSAAVGLLIQFHIIG